MDDGRRAFADEASKNQRSLHADVCIVGGGSGGLSVAAGAAQMGARVVLIERARMGGDCLNTGCVPSKSLIAAADAAHAAANGHAFGVHSQPPRIDFAKVHDHVQEVIAGIAPHDSAERFEGLGVKVIQSDGRFVAPDTVVAGAHSITARRFVIATGSRPAMPDIAGLEEVPHLTNESVFELQERPGHLLVLGGGPIGVELAQAFRRLGAQVSLIERFNILPRDEPEAVAIVRRALVDEGVELHENARARRAYQRDNGAAIELGTSDTGPTTVAGTHLLVAAGRRPNIEDLNLDAAGVAWNDRGIVVDSRMRSSNKRIFAIGDVAGGPQFTHIAGYHAGVVVRNALFGLPAKVDYRALPWVTYTDPELAHVGLTETEARDAGHRVTALIEPLSGNDRARTERRTDGLAKIIVGSRGAILGATLVGPNAGELIGMWGLAITNRLKLSAVAGMIAPYPTLSEISKRAAGQYFTPSLYSPRMRAVVRAIQRLVP